MIPRSTLTKRLSYNKNLAFWDTKTFFVDASVGYTVTYSGRLEDWCTGFGTQTLVPKKHFKISIFSCVSTNTLK